jgi:hypothetical protein
MKFEKLTKATRSAAGKDPGPRRLKLLDGVVLALLALAGFTRATLWLVLVGGAALAIEASWGTLRRLRTSEASGERRPPSAKVIAFLVTGAVAALVFAGVAYALGALLAALAT